MHPFLHPHMYVGVLLSQNDYFYTTQNTKDESLTEGDAKFESEIEDVATDEIENEDNTKKSTIKEKTPAEKV